MASILPGFEYDIFISYRHKDNKGDQWVTEFVKALKTELESTFKEDISIYFDTNPHDGLLETHSVDKSLEGKLKCLIFIPIISQTYCDTKSFAWQHEFCSFNRMVKEDQFGRDIKLSNGNVASRILPIKIHDLDSEDKALLEKEIGGVLRAVDFIYKESGVNRPLRSNEENPGKNQNQTIYRNQVNKVANAIKEIMTAMKSPVDKTSRKATENPSLPPGGGRKSHLKNIVFGSLGLMILFALIYAASQYFSPTKETAESVDKSIAVLPFINMSNDPAQDYFSNGIMEEILTDLYKIGDLTVTSRTSTMGYKGTTKKVTEIGQELKVGHILEGSVQKYGDSVRITVQLIDAAHDKHIWAERYTRKLKDVFAIQSEVAMQIATSLKANLSPELQQQIKSRPTNNMEAYDLVLKGREQVELYYSEFELSYIDKGIDYFNKAIALDSNYSSAYAGLAFAHWVTAQFAPDYGPLHWKKSKQYSLKAIELDHNNAIAYVELAQVQYKWEGDSTAARQSFQKAIQLAPGDWNVHESVLTFYQRVNDCGNLERETKVQIAMGASPESIISNYFLPLCQNNPGKIAALKPELYGVYGPVILLYQGKYKECIKLLNADLAVHPNNLAHWTALGEAYALSGDVKMAEQTVKKLNELSGKRYVSKSAFACIYLALGQKEKAFRLLEEALKANDLMLRVLKEFSFSVNSVRDDSRFVSIMKSSWIPNKL